MLLREVRYGVNIGIDSVSIDPFGPTVFNYNFGSVRVSYDQYTVTATVPGRGQRSFTLTQLIENELYRVTTTPLVPGACEENVQAVQTDGEGTLLFKAEVGQGCQVRAQILIAEPAGAGAAGAFTAAAAQEA